MSEQNVSSSEPVPGSVPQSPVYVEQSEDPAGLHSLPFPIIGLIDYSDDGILSSFIVGKLPPSTGMAFVLLYRPDADQQSALQAARHQTPEMPIEIAEARVQPQPNRIYVAPNGKLLTFQDGAFYLRDVTDVPRGGSAIDDFLRSLAAMQKQQSIGVLLSARPADALNGLRAIRGEGGIAIVEESATMGLEAPLRLALADSADFILPAGGIVAELHRLAEQFHQPELQLLEKGALPLELEPQFTRILKSMRSVSGVDFRLYKPATLRRRLARRMILRHVDTLSKYVALLQAQPEELRELQEDMLINVTRFFRDPAVFDSVKTDVLPRILEQRPADQQIRIWIAGCSTGEEAYSIAMILLEHLSRQAVEPAIQIFGTDASDRSIEKARQAFYPDTIAADVSTERLRRFFVKVDNGYQVSKRVRDLCIFARQNLCNDPPFSRLDLISCRNLLIYLGPEVQQRILSTFHYALRPTGYLLLGSAESIREHPDLFSPLDRKQRLFAKHPLSRSVIPDPIPKLISTDLDDLIAGYTPPTQLNETELQRAADRIVMARYAPAGVVINERLDVLQVRGHTAPYLEMSPGSASLNLLRMAREGFGAELRESVRRAINEDVPVVAGNLQVRGGEDIHKFALEVLPIPIGPGRARHFLVIFLPKIDSAVLEVSSLAKTPASSAPPDELSREVARLQHDLGATKLYLQSLIEERDGRNQELTSAYEELQSANEELQSTNEEVETAKEELQSANEELQTLNEELRNRNMALTHAGNDFTNLLNAVNIPVVILGSDLTIREYTPPAERLMRVRAADLGRHIGEIRLNLKLDNVEPLLAEVLDTLVTKELDVQDHEGRWHLLRIRPYRTLEDRIDGLVLVLLDIDQIRQGEIALRLARDFANAVIEAVRTPIAVLDSDLRVRSHNEALRMLSGLGAEDIHRRSFPELAALLWGIGGLRPQLRALRDEPTGANWEAEYEVVGSSPRVFRLSACCVRDLDKPWILVMIEDITDWKSAEKLLYIEQERLSGEIQSTAVALDSSQQELRALAARLFQSQEDERRRVAMELHDDIGQKLALLEIDIERFRHNSLHDNVEFQRMLEDLKGRVTGLSADVRALSHGLHPSVLDDLGLALALKDLVREFGRQDGLVVTFSKRQAPENIPRHIAAAFYRIAQEALRNAAKHAGRTHVKVTLEGTKTGLRLSIRDFGEGFDAGAVEHRGLGLVTMEERARLIAGSFSLQSSLGEGTTVTVIAPLALADLEK